MKILFLLSAILLYTTNIFDGIQGQSSTAIPADPCNLGPFCKDGSKAANPYDCTTYYVCGSGHWILMNCSVGTFFDSISLDCKYEEEATCQYCPPFTGTTPPPVTLDPGLCENMTECVINQKYPDRSNCTTYFLCQDGEHFLHISCATGYIFDIYDSDCVQPGNDFFWSDCYYRCVTPPPSTDPSTTRD